MRAIGDSTQRGATDGQFACTESPRLQDKVLSRFVVQFYPFKHPFKVLSGDPIRNHCRGGLDCKPDCNMQATHLWKGATCIGCRQWTGLCKQGPVEWSIHRFSFGMALKKFIVWNTLQHFIVRFLRDWQQNSNRHFKYLMTYRS